MADVRATAELDVDVTGSEDLARLQKKLDALARERKGRLTIEEKFLESKRSGARERTIKIFTDDNFNSQLKELRSALSGLKSEESEELKSRKFSTDLLNTKFQREQQDLISEAKKLRDRMAEERRKLPLEVGKTRESLAEQRRGLQDNLSRLRASLSKSEDKIKSQKKPVKALADQKILTRDISKMEKAINALKSTSKSEVAKTIAQSQNSREALMSTLRSVAQKENDLVSLHRKRIADLNSFTASETARIAAERGNLNARKRIVEKEFSQQSRQDAETRLNRQLTNQAFEKAMAKSREIEKIERSGRYATESKGLRGFFESRFGTSSLNRRRGGGLYSYTRGPMTASENLEDPFQVVIGGALLFSKVMGSLGRGVVMVAELVARGVATLVGLGGKLGPFIGIVAAIAAPVVGAIGALGGFVMVMKTIARVINVAIVAVTGLVAAVVALVAANRAAKQSSDLNYQSKLQRLTPQGMLSGSMLAGLEDGSLTSGIEAVGKFNELLRKELLAKKNKKGVVDGNADLAALGLGQKSLLKMKKSGELDFPRVLGKLISDFEKDVKKTKSPERAQSVLASRLEKIREAFGEDIAKLFLKFAEQADPGKALQNQLAKNKALRPDMDTGALARFKSSFDEMKMRIGNAFSTFGSDLAPSVTRGIEAFATMLDSNKDLIRTSMAKSFGGVVDSITTFIQSISSDQIKAGFASFEAFMAGVRDGFQEAMTFIGNIFKALKQFLEFTGIITPGDPNKPKSQEAINKDIDQMNYDFKKFQQVMSGLGSAVETFTNKVPDLMGAFDNLISVIEKVASLLGVDAKSKAEAKRQESIAAPAATARSAALNPVESSVQKIADDIEKGGAGFAETIRERIASIARALEGGAPSWMIENVMAGFNRDLGLKIQSMMAVLRLEQEKIPAAKGGFRNEQLEDKAPAAKFNALVEAGAQLKAKAEESVMAFNATVGNTLAARAADANAKIDGSAMLGQAGAIGSAIGSAFAAIAGGVRVGVQGGTSGGAGSLPTGRTAPTGAQ